MLQALAHGFDVALAVDAPLGEGAGDAVIGLGLEVAERQVLEFPLEAPGAEPVGERRVDLARLQRDAPPSVRIELACVPQPRQLQRETRNDEARVRSHGEQHLAQRLGLSGVQALLLAPPGGQADFAEPRQIAGQLQRLGADAPAERFGVDRHALPAQSLQPRGGDQIAVLGERADEFGGFARGGERLGRYSGGGE